MFKNAKQHQQKLQRRKPKHKRVKEDRCHAAQSKGENYEGERSRE